jgi:hypothetical protein
VSTCRSDKKILAGPHFSPEVPTATAGLALAWILHDPRGVGETAKHTGEILETRRVRSHCIIGRRIRVGATTLGILSTLLACKYIQKGTGESKDSGAPTAPSAPTVSLPPLAPRDVAAGDVPNGGPWLGAFRVGRTEHDAGLTWSLARINCRNQDMDLCSEPQWHRACSLDPEIGKVASWTATARGAGGFVVRGPSGCGSSTVVAGAQTDPARIGLCCSRAIAIQTTNHHAGFLRAVAGKLMSYERALNAHSTAAVEALLDDSVTLYSLKNISKQVAKARFDGAFRQHPEETVLHGTCEVTLDVIGNVEHDNWVAECDKVVEHSPEVAVVVTRYEFGGPGTQLRLVQEPRIIRNWAAP